MKTTLQALAKQATLKGPCIKPSPCTPPDAPHWNGRVTTTLDATPPDVQTAKATLLIFLNATLTNKGRQDDRPIRAAAAILYYEGKEWGHLEFTLGDQVTKRDTETGSLCPALALLSSFLTSSLFTGSACLYSRSEAAVKQFLNLGQHPQQHFVVEYANTIHDTLAAHPNLSLSIHHSK